MIAAAFHDASQALPAADGAFLAHLRGIDGSGAGTQVVVENIWAMYFVVTGDHRMAVGDRLRIALPRIGEVEATVIWGGPQILGCKFTAPITLEGLLADGPATASNADVTARDIPEQGEASFGARFIKFRQSAGLTQAKLASQIGVSVPAICAWERNKSRPKAKRLEAISAILGVSVGELIGQAEGPSLRRLIRNSRERIAQAAGVSPDRVEISIKL
ncbi:MAG: helix-turn-helix transcriptional regulator [Sphingopyxis sp.]|nr:helix-turn-helix transcriptional regulator [Sphingopyxis sp.]